MEVPPSLTGFDESADDGRFPFLGVGSPEGWDEWFQFGAESGDGGVGLSTDPVPTYRDPTRILGGDDGVQVVDVAVDDCGLAYALAASGDVYRYDPDRGAPRRLACLWRGDPPGEPRAICVTRENIYVASVIHERGTSGSEGGEDGGSEETDTQVSGRVQALSRHLLATRWLTTDPFVRPRRIVETRGAVYVLDDGRPESDDGEPTGFLAHLTRDGRAVRVLEGLAAADVTVDDDGRLALLDVSDEGPMVRVYDLDVTGDGESELAELDDERIPPAVFDVVGGGRVEPACLAVGAPTHAVVGVDTDFGGQQVLYRYVAREESFERVPGLSRSCVRLVLSPAQSAVDGIDERTPGDGGETEPNDDDGGEPTETPPPTDLTGETHADDRPSMRAERRLYAIEGQTHALSVLRRATRNRTALGGTGPYAGRVVGRLDGGEAGTVWHRVTTDIQLRGAGTGVRLRYYATDDPDLALEGLRSLQGVGPTFADRLRAANVLGVAGLARLDAETVAVAAGTSISRVRPWIEAANERVRAWNEVTHPSPVDILLDDAAGRYLWIELTLIGDEFDTPRVNAVRAYFPRRSYLRYLPAIYREDEASAAFLGRFLSLFESRYVDVEEAFASVTRYLDPTGVPDEYLTWLGGWLAVADDESWPASARRALLGEAPALFRQRGTEAGLRRVLDLLLAEVELPRRDWETARTREAALLQRWVDAGYLTSDERTAMLDAHDELAESDASREEALYTVWTYGALNCIDPDATDLVAAYRRLVACPQCFLVLVRSVLTDEQLRRVRRVVETWTPAHSTGRAVALRPGVRLGGNSFLGLNTTLVEPSFVLGESVLGRETALSGKKPPQLGTSRFGRDARMS